MTLEQKDNHQPLILTKDAKLDGHKIFPHFLQVYGKLMEEGQADPFFVFQATDKVIHVTTRDGNLMGYCVWRYNAEFTHSWVVFSFVDPEHRGKGVFGLMNEILENITKDLGGDMIQSYVHVDNKASLKANEKIGRMPVYVMTRKRI